MSKEKEFTVVREHIDSEGKLLAVGSTRVAVEAEVQHLIPQTLIAKDDAPKAEEKAPKPVKAPETKAEEKAPETKTEA